MRRSPPLYALPVAVALVAAALLPFVAGFLARHDSMELAWRWKLALLNFGTRVDANDGRPRALRIVAVGDSLLLAATPPDDDVETAVAAHGVPVRYARLPSYDGDDTIAALELAVDSHPDVLVIETNELFYQPVWRAGLVEFSRYTLHGLRGSRVRSPVGRREEAPPVAGGIFLADAEAVARVRDFRRAHFTGVTPRARALLRRARALGVRVVLLEMPIGQRGRATYGDDALRVVDATLALLVAEEGGVRWRFPDRVEDSDFTDYRHLSRAARSRFTDWYARELATTLARPAAGAEAPR